MTTSKWKLFFILGVKIRAHAMSWPEQYHRLISKLGLGEFGNISKVFSNVEVLAVKELFGESKI